jgi:hypothetical protein
MVPEYPRDSVLPKVMAPEKAERLPHGIYYGNCRIFYCGGPEASE